ncbi:hypothetical protein NECAME_03774 [Necator americanus]|uniref:Uncharacterized protein n=1 Tax=Necator americanus TaxID=51031 RepID=W2T340_NECAM|nr:hypothetical protein NECAME_03774 [Necator americanus]ETN75392.1 hypothetical protein NECAME_03774 [Necator americanus]
MCRLVAPTQLYTFVAHHESSSRSFHERLTQKISSSDGKLWTAALEPCASEVVFRKLQEDAYRSRYS